MSAAASMLHAHDPALWVQDVLGVDPDPWQSDFMTANDPRIILNCCRQAGKSTCVGWRVAHKARFKPGYFGVCTAPSDRQSRELFDKIRKPLEMSGALEVKALTDTLHELKLANGSRIICLPSSPDTIRGFSKADEILADEAGMIDDEVFGAVEPMLIRSRGSFIMMSTPKGARGHFHRMFTSSNHWRKFTVGWKEVLPFGHFTLKDLEQFKEEHGQMMFEQEFENRFISAIDSVFSNETIEKALAEDGDVFAW